MKAADITNKLHTQLRIHMTVLIKGSQNQAIGSMNLHQLYVLLHHLHFLV